MPQIKLLMVVNEFVEASSNELIYQLVKHLDHNSYRIFAGSIRDDEGIMAARMAAAGATIVHFTPGNVLRNIRQVIIREHIDLVHTHVLRADLLGGIAARSNRGVRLISTKHNIGYVRTQAGWLHRTLLYWPVLLLPHHVVIVTDAARQKLLRLPFLPESRVVTIPNGIDIDRYSTSTARPAIRREFAIAPDIPLVIYTGRLVSGKGLEELLRAMKRLHTSQTPVHLLIAGDGELRPQLEEAVIQYGLSQLVTFAGFRRDVPDLLAAADIFALPSHSEGLPLSLLEAMAAGKAVIVTPVGGMSGTIVDDETGLFVPVADVIALAAALERLAADAGLRARLGAAAQSYIRQHASITHMVAAYDRLYRHSLDTSNTHTWETVHDTQRS